jgi:hypothetical protein
VPLASHWSQLALNPALAHTTHCWQLADRATLRLHADSLYPRTPAALRGCPSAKISHHEARASLLGGQPLDSNFPPYANTAYQSQLPPSQAPYSVPPGGYHDREGFPTTLPNPVRRAPRMYIPNSRWTWAFMLTAIAQAIIALALESYVTACPLRR